MAVQQETPIGDDALDELMAQLEEETAGMVAPPPAVKKTAAVIEEDDPLAGLDLNDDADALKAAEKAAAGGYVSAEHAQKITDELAGLDDTEHLNASTANAAHLQKSIAQANAGQAVERALVEPNIDDELAALEAEMGDAAEVAKKPDDKFAALASKMKDKYPSDVPKAAVAKASDPLPEAGVARTDPEVVKPVAKPNLDDELATIAKTMPKMEAKMPENPNPPPEPVRAKSSPAGLQHVIDVEEFRRDISVSETNLDNCMMEQAGLIAYYVQQAALAEAQHLRLKARFGVLEAALYDEHRKQLIAKAAVDPALKVTEKAVENAVKIDPKWLKNQNVVIEAESIATINKGLVESLKQRRDMIIQLGADRREEGKGAARIVAAGAAHADAKARAAELAKRT
jgi:hypothetical protein